ncbi:hypothetical protein [Streptomyces sp. NPDC001068]|uniref:hypothetical protein n=1 Tax=Streptomyces sp. NPDC001068 TaxID=3364544 RepID=UPI00368C3034
MISLSDCGCSRRCSCTVTAGPGVTVDGNGSPAHPYVISAGAAVPTEVTAADTPTVDTTVSGSGGAADPYVVSAAVILDPTPPGGGSNLAHAGPDGVYVECADVRQCLSAGDGIAYDAATGEIAARPSADAGNALALGTDGGLLVPEPAALVTGCGLTGDGSAATPLAAAVSAWPYVCDADDNGGVIVCGGDGVLRGEPRSHAQFFSQFYDEDFANVPVPAGSNVFVRRMEFPFTNPDPCNAAQVVVCQEMEVELTLPAGAGAEYGFDGPDEMIYYRNTGTSTATGIHFQVTKVRGGGIILPGQTVTLGFDILMGRGTAGATYTHIQGILRALFVTR